MKNKTDVAWAVTYMLFGILTGITGVANIIGGGLPDTARIIIGIIDLISLPVLIFLSVRKFMGAKKEK